MSLPIIVTRRKGQNAPIFKSINPSHRSLIHCRIRFSVKYNNHKNNNAQTQHTFALGKRCIRDTRKSICESNYNLFIYNVHNKNVIITMVIDTA